MEFSPAAGPIHALQLIHKHGPFNTHNGDRQTKRVRLHLAGQCANCCKPACPVITQVGQDQGRPALACSRPAWGSEFMKAISPVSETYGVTIRRFPFASPLQPTPLHIGFQVRLELPFEPGPALRQLGATAQRHRRQQQSPARLRRQSERPPPRLRNPQSQAISPFLHMSLHVRPRINIASPPRSVNRRWRSTAFAKAARAKSQAGLAGDRSATSVRKWKQAALPVE